MADPILNVSFLLKKRKKRNRKRVSNALLKTSFIMQVRFDIHVCALLFSLCALLNCWQTARRWKMKIQIFFSAFYWQYSCQIKVLLIFVLLFFLWFYNFQFVWNVCFTVPQKYCSPEVSAAIMFRYFIHFFLFFLLLR